MQKSITKIIIKNNVRIYLSNYKHVIQSIINFHKYPPFPNIILANAICGFAPLKFLYDSSNLMIRLKTNGPIESLIIEIKNSSLRALISNPNIETEYDEKKYNDIPLILGIGDEGIIQISRVIKNDTFTSDVALARADIVSDVAYYLNQSDQIYSAVLNNVKLNEDDSSKIDFANNAIFQLLPNHNENDLIWIEKFIKENDFKNMNLDDYEKKIKGTLHDIKEIDAICWCNKKKVIDAINLLSIKEKENLFKKSKSIETRCDFCQTIYLISRKEV